MNDSTKRFLTEEERKDPDKIFMAIDYAVAVAGRALLDCGHETDGRVVGLIPQDNGTYIAVCGRCSREYENKKGKDVIESVKVDIIKTKIENGVLKMYKLKEIKK